MTKRTTLRLDDERARLIDQAKRIVASDSSDDPPVSIVIDAALTHPIQSEQNLEDAWDDLDPGTIQRFNTDVLVLRYRTSVESR